MLKLKFRQVNIANIVIIWGILFCILSKGISQTISWTLVWDKNTESDMYYYEIFRQVNGEGFKKINIVYHPTSEFTDNTIQSGKLYQYKIRAVDVFFNKSDYSETIQAAIPAIEGLPATLTLPADTTVVYLLDNYVQDPDNADAELQWSAVGYSSLTVQIDNATRTMTIITPSNWQGSEKITLSVSDPDGWEDRWAINVSAQSATNLPPQITDIPNQTIQEGEQFAPIDLNKYVNDPDNADSELEWAVQGNHQLTISIDNNRIAHIQVPDDDWYGEETVTFIVTDPSGESAQDAVKFTVTPVNDPPVVQKIPDQTVKAGENFAPISLDPYVSDVDNADDEIQWTVQGGNKLSAQINNQRQLVVTVVDSRWSGRETLTLTATDPQGASDQTTVVFTVLGVNNDEFYSNVSFKPDVKNNVLQIEWQTAAPSKDEIRYGIVPDFTEQQSTDSVFTTNHRTIITNLQGNVEYNFQITSQTASGAVYQTEVFYYILDETNEVNVYPIPYVAGENQNSPYIFFTNMPNRSMVYIYNLLGEPVFSRLVEGNSFAWDVRNNFGQEIQPGLYIYVVKNKNNQKVASGKLIVVK